MAMTLMLRVMMVQLLVAAGMRAPAGQQQAAAQGGLSQGPAGALLCLLTLRRSSCR
jgi:hypothetical protein